MIFPWKLAEDVKHHLIREPHPLVDIRDCPVAAWTAASALLCLGGLLLLLLAGVLLLLMLVELLAGEEDVRPGFADVDVIVAAVRHKLWMAHGQNGCERMSTRSWAKS